MKNTIRIILVSLLVIIFILEIGLRITGKFKTYSERVYGKYTTYWNETRDSRFHSHNPNDSFYLDQQEFRYLYLTNSYGHREREIDDSRPDSILKVFVFGDSFAEGVGAPYDSTWPRFLEQQLRMDSIAADVYICSSAGGDPYDNYVAFKDLFLKHRPSHVIFTFNTSDLSDYAFRTGFQRFRGNDRVVFRKGEWWHGWYRYSHIVRAYIHSLGEYGPTLLKDEEWGRLQSEAVDSIAHCLDVTDKLCMENNIRFLTVTHSGPLEICLDDPASRSIGKIEQHDYKVDVAHINDGIEARISGAHCMDYGWANDGHYNSAGYEVFSEVLMQVINRDFPQYWK